MRPSLHLPVLLLLTLLAACAPTVRYLPPDRPIVYAAPYNALFDATLQELTATYRPVAASRRTFSVSEADRDTGLITAIRRESGTTANLRYRSPERQNPGFGFNLLVPLPVTPTEETTITVVVRPEAQGSSIIYSTQGPDGRTSADAETLMQRVIIRLDERFASEAGVVVRQRAIP